MRLIERATPVSLMVLAAVLTGTVGAQSPAGWRLTPEVRITSERGPDYEFTRIDGIAPGPNGLVFVSDIREPMLRVFDPRGSYVRAIGRTGSGPGEFRRVSYLGVLGDTIWTIDVLQRRTTLFTAEGRVLATFQYGVSPNVAPPGTGLSSALVTAVLPGGVAFGRASYGSSDQAAGRVPRFPLLRLTRDGATLDTIAWVSTKNSQLTLAFGRGELFLSQPFSDAPIAVVGSHARRVYVIDRTVATDARAATLGVTALDVNGDTLWQRRYPYTPKRLDPDRREEALNRRIQLNNAEVPRAQLRNATFLPDYAPRVTAAVVAEDGSLWLRCDDGPGDVEHLVIGPDGTVAGALALPRNVTVKAVRGNLVWTTEADDDGVQTIVRWRIVR